MSRPAGSPDDSGAPLVFHRRFFMAINRVSRLAKVRRSTLRVLGSRILLGAGMVLFAQVAAPVAGAENWSPGFNLGGGHVYATAIYRGDLIVGGDFVSADSRGIDGDGLAYIARRSHGTWYPVGTTGVNGLVT